MWTCPIVGVLALLWFDCTSPPCHVFLSLFFCYYSTFPFITVMAALALCLCFGIDGHAEFENECMHDSSALWAFVDQNVAMLSPAKCLSPLSPISHPAPRPASLDSGRTSLSNSNNNASLHEVTGML